MFLDETGDEKYSDPNHPVFGIGGCAVLSDEYVRRIQKPWNLLKRNVLGLAGMSFHAVEFDRSRPSKEKIVAINSFLTRGFHRIAVTSDIDTKRPNDFDGHATVSTCIFEYLRRLIARYNVRRCMVFFEQSERGDKLLEENLPLYNIGAKNLFSEAIEVNGYLLPKQAMEPGLEVADLIIHTAGKQQRKYGRGYVNGSRHFTPDFRGVFHSVDRAWTLYMSVTAIENHNEQEVIVDRWPES